MRGDTARLPWDLEPALEVWLEPGTSELTVTVAGRLDAETAGRLVGALEEAEPDARGVVIDLRLVEGSMAAGWPVLEAHLERLRARGVPVGVNR